MSRRELQREKVWSRIHLVPLLLAEGDRDAYRRQQAALEREKEIMKDVPGWEVSGSVDEVTRGKVGRLIVIALGTLATPVRVGCLTGGQKRLQQPEVPAWGVGCGSMMVVPSLYLLLQQSYQAIISFHSAVHDQLSGLCQRARTGKVTGGRVRWSDVRRAAIGWRAGGTMGGWRPEAGTWLPDGAVPTVPDGPSGGRGRV